MSDVRAIMSVDGPVPADEVGIALTHEHLLSNSSCWLSLLEDDDAEGFAELPVTTENWRAMRSRSCENRDNLSLDDADLAASELGEFLAAGGRTVVDVTSVGMSRDPLGLRAISRATGTQIVMGAGVYCEVSHPDWVAETSTADLTRMIEREVTEGVDGVRAGIIGEIGVNGQDRHGRYVGEITPEEDRSLRAACRASRSTGAALLVHLPNRASALAPVMALIEEEEVSADRVVLGHMSSVPDFEKHLEALERGYWIAYDDFGMELENPWFADVGDARRIDWVLDVFERGHGGRLLISHDVWCKVMLTRFGGNGYAHILKTIVPQLRSRGFEDRDVQTLLVDNPAEILTFECGS